MPTERKSRREVLTALVRTGGLLMVGAAGLYAFAPDSQRAAPAIKTDSAAKVNPSEASPNPTSTQVSQWKRVEVPAADRMMKIDVYTDQRPPIGLTELYLAVSGSIGGVVIAGVFGSNARRTPSSEDRIFGLQIIKEPFKVNLAEIRVGDGNLSEIVAFAKEAVPAIDNFSGGLLRRESSMIGVIPRPPGGARYALVFEEGIAEYKGSPTFQSHLGISFGFEQQRGPRGII
jgi:hypothetical protein